MRKIATNQAKALAKSNRKRMTVAEVLVWQEFRKLREAGIRVRRQFAIENFVADFACIKSKVVVEIDGHSHDESRLKHDADRQTRLEELGWTVLRFSNIEAMENPGRIAQIVFDLAHRGA